MTDNGNYVKLESCKRIISVATKDVDKSHSVKIFSTSFHTDISTG